MVCRFLPMRYMRSPRLSCLSAWGLVLLIGLGQTGCGFRGDLSEDVLLAPWLLIGAVMDASDHNQFAEAAAHRQAHPERIPAAVTDRIMAHSTYQAGTLDELLASTGLTPYRDNVFIVCLGTYDQVMWVYYRTDAALRAAYDPITRRIRGPVQNYRSHARAE